MGAGPWPDLPPPIITKHHQAMKFEELPALVQERLTAERAELSKRNFHSAYEVLAYNQDGTRYFRARRVCRPWRDDKGNYMPFGNGTYWDICYGAVQFRYHRMVMGPGDYELCDGKRYTRSRNGTQIPSSVKSKKEVMDILTKIGIFQF